MIHREEPGVLNKMSAAEKSKEPQQARAIARRDAILAAAKNLLRQKGLGGISTTNIANSAAIPVGSVYRYFKNKNDIIGLLHQSAYDDVIGAVASALGGMEPGLGFRKTQESLIRIFWQEARSHPTFRILTRWANAQGSLWEVTPGPDSGIGEMIQKALDVSGVMLPEDRSTAMLRTAVATVSVLIDQAIEEEGETAADALIDEIIILLSRYFD